MKTNDPIKGDGFQQMLPRGRGVNGLIRRPTPLDTKETQVEPLDTKETHVEPQDASGQLLTGARGRRRPRARERSPGTGSHANGRSGKRLCSRPALLLFISSLTADKRLLRNHENVLMVTGGRAAAVGGAAPPPEAAAPPTLAPRMSPSCYGNPSAPRPRLTGRAACASVCSTS